MYHANLVLLSTCQPDRPNPIGLSACELVRVESKTLHVLGCDLLDGTAVLDVKPYVPYCDALNGANSGWAGDAPPMDYEGMRLTPEQEAERERAARRDSPVSHSAS